MQIVANFLRLKKLTVKVKKIKIQFCMCNNHSCYYTINAQRLAVKTLKCLLYSVGKAV